MNHGARAYAMGGGMHRRSAAHQRQSTPSPTNAVNHAFDSTPCYTQLVGDPIAEEEEEEIEWRLRTGSGGGINPDLLQCDPRRETGILSALPLMLAFVMIGGSLSAVRPPAIGPLRETTHETTLERPHSLIVSSNRDAITRMSHLGKEQARRHQHAEVLDVIDWSPSDNARFTIISDVVGWNASTTEQTLAEKLAKYTRIYFVETATQRFERSPFRDELHTAVISARPSNVNFTAVFWDTSCSVMARAMRAEHHTWGVNEAECQANPDAAFTTFGTWAIQKGGIERNAVRLVDIPRESRLEEQMDRLFG